MPPKNSPKQKSRILTPYEYMEQFGTGMAKGVGDQISGLATLVSNPKESYKYLRSEFDNLIQNPEKIPQYVKDDVLEQWKKLSSGPAGAGEVFSQYLRLPGKGIPKRDIFIGKKSPSFDTETNELARKMEKEGKSKAEIWKETGNFRGHDDQWRQEVSVKDLTIDVEKLREKDPFKVKPLPQRINAFVQSLKPEGSTRILRDQFEATGTSLPVQRFKEIFSPRKRPTRFGLEEIVEAPALDKAYPGIISEITAERMPDKGKTLGYVQGDLMGLRPFNPFERDNPRFGAETYDPKTTLVHELQHIVQNKEGWGPGGSPEIWGDSSGYMPPGFIEKEYYDALYRSQGNDYDQHVAAAEAEKRRKLAEEVYGKSEPPAKRDKPKISAEERKKAAELVKRIKKEYAPFDLYQRLSGEAEARAAARRADLTPEQRRARFPELDFDVPFSEQLDVRSGLVRPYTSGRLAKYAQGGQVSMNGDYLQSGITPQPNSYYPMANMQGSSYAAPLNYNQPKEVVGGYDAKINPMTGQEIPEVNFAGGGLASLANSPYADSDVMRVQMTPREVAGLQQLAMSYGADERDLYDPVTGEPRFSFLKKILPMVAGALLGPAGFGKMSPFMAATTVGLGYGLIEGDLKKGLTAGLSAYSGASITGGLKEAAGVSSQVKAAPPASSLKDTAFKISTDSVGQDLPLSSLRQAPISTVTGKPMMPVQTVTQAPPLPTPSPPPSGFFGTQAQGLRNVFTTREGADAFMRGMSGGSTSPFGQAVGRYATIAGALIPFAEEPKPLNVPSGDDIVYIPGQPNPLYGTGANQPPQLPGKYYKRTPQGFVPYDPWASGGRGYAEGGAVGVVPGSTGDTASPITAPDEDALVRANREYVEELNRRAMNPVLNPYGMIAAGGGLGGTNQPWSGLSPYGTPISSGAGTTSEAAGAGAGDIAAFLGTQIGINWLMQPGNAVALKDWIAGGMKGPNPFFKKDEAKPPEETKPAETTTQPPADTTVVNPAAITSGLSGIASTLPGAGESTSTVTVETPENTPSGDVAPSQPSSTVVNPAAITSGLSGIASTLPNKFTTALPYVGEPVYDAAGNMTGFKYPDGRFEPAEGYTKEPGQLDSDLQARTRVPDTSAPLSNYLSGASALGSGLTALAPAAAPVATGLTSILPVGSEEVIQSIVSPGSSAAANAAAAETAGADVAGTEATAGTEGIGGKIIPGLQTALGLYGAYKGIESGNEAQAALGGYGAATGLAALKVFGAKPAIGALAGAGPIGLAAAAIAAIGASLVNTKEYGDVALRNYWNAVDQGRGFGSAPPEELAQGFINFYRTNKNQFAGQEKYGRTGNEDFVYDMTQVINNAIKDGKIDKNVDAPTMYKQVVQPWLNSMGSGPQDADARRIQDFMMTDLIHNFMQGKPISNAQVKGDKKFKMVSERPVYAGAAQPEAEPAYGPVGGMNAPENPFAEERRAARREAREKGFYGGGAIGDDYNFGFAHGGMPGEYKAGGRLLNGPGDGMSDSIPAVIRGKGVQRAALADGEFVIPADVVSHLGNGSTNAGAKKLHRMMARIRQARTGRTRQAPEVRVDKFLPA